MKKLFYLFFLSLFPWYVFGQQSLHNNHIKVSERWIKELKDFDFNRTPNSLVLDFEQETSIKLKKFTHTAFLNFLFVNLDSDENNEILLYIGGENTYIETEFCVLKQIDKQWYIIYHNHVWLHNDYPVLNVFADYSPNKIFYITKHHDYGTGIYLKKKHFFKIIDNSVHEVLEVVEQGHIAYGWGYFMCQNVESTINLSSSESTIHVYFSYEFYVSNDYKEHVSLIKEEGRVAYKWQANKKKFNVVPYAGGLPLNEDKIKCFGDFGNDTLFQQAFKNELSIIAEKGDEDQKARVKAFLEKVKTKGNAKSFELKPTKKGDKITPYKREE